MENRPEKKNNNRWLALINIPIQMGLIIYLMAVLGSWLDRKYPSEKVYYDKILIIVGVALAMYNVHRQVTAINKDQDKK